MKNLSYAIVFVLFFGLLSVTAYGQEPAVAPAIKPKVVESQVMFKKTVWRRMDLKERQNRPFFSINGEITAVILEAAKKGLIFPYENDSCLTRMAIADFEDRIKVDENSGDGDFDDQGDTSNDDDPFAALNNDDDGNDDGPLFIPPVEFDIMELKERLFFDRLRSRMYYETEAITLYLPATSSAYNFSGFNKQIASFKFSELEKLFREVMPEKSVWYNNQNQAHHRNFADAFALRLFSAPIIKISNADDQNIREIYGQGKKGIIAAQRLEHELLDFENQLWEF